MLNITALRGGAATLYYPIWHYEAPELIVLKNNRGVEENRIRQLDYCIQLNKLIYERIIKRGNITLFSPNDVPGMYEAFYNDQEKFEELYTKAEADESIRKRVVPAMELFTQIMQERASTGRIYLMNVDHCNTHSSFDEKVAPVHMSNLCVAGHTPILIKEDGIKKEVAIKDYEDKWVQVYNGEQFLPAFVRKTSDAAKLKRVRYTIKNYKGEVYRIGYIDATDEHKWYDTAGKELRTVELKVGTEMVGHVLQEDGCIFEGTVIVTDIEQLEGTYPTWCFNQPEDHTGVFNGVLAGQCVEISLPTKPLDNILDEKGEIGLCILAAVNVTAVTKEEMGDVCEMCVRALDALIDYQTYPVRAAEISTRNRRSLGIGIINYAHFLAKNGTYFTNTTKANEITHELMELFQYSLIKASVKLAQEYGPCGWFNETKYSKGILPIDTYKKDLDDICPNDLKCDWEALRQDVLKYGMRNSTLSALMPSECQVKENEMLMNDSTKKTLGELLVEAGVNVELIEDAGIPLRISVKPFTLYGNREVTDVYYNGKVEVYEVEFMDGTKYKFTGNHLLKVHVDNSPGVYSEGCEAFKCVKDLNFQEKNGKNELVAHPNGYLVVKSVTKAGIEHTWDVSTPDEEYVLSNGCISHNTSSQVANATNGIEPPRGLVSIKQSKDGILKQVVPDIKTLGLNYETAWNMQDNVGYIHKVCIMQKFVDQAISANEYYMPSRYPGGKVPMTELIKMKLLGYKYGIKTWYYHNTNDGADDRADEINAGCESGACAI